MPAPAVDFPIEWVEADDPELTWERDDMHMPFAVSPLSADYIQVLIDGMRYGREKVDNPWRWDVRFWNGYVYMTAREIRPVPDDGEATRIVVENQRALIPTTTTYWNDRAVPELRAIRDWFASVDIDGADLAGLADLWVEGWDRAARAWEIHFFAIRAPYQVTDDLADLYEGLVPDAPPGEALRMIQGHAHELHEVDDGIDRLASIVTSDASLRQLFAEGVPSMGRLAEMPAGVTLLDALGAFLADHGHLGGSYDDLGFPTWSERPEMVLADVTRRIATGGPTSMERRATQMAEADALADDVRARLADRPAELAAFEDLLAHARAVGPLTEIHNYWIDRLAQACVRTMGLQVGARLVAADVIGHPEDVLYLTRHEVEAVLRAPADRRTTVAERRVLHDLQKSMSAPYRVGRVPDEPAETDRFDGARYEPGADGRLRGTGASRGVYRGIARVVLGPDDFGKVQLGDVIVAPSTNPSWLPLFTVAGGLLTNTGGVACHAAVVAREFGLPAVVGLGDATSRVRDGATVELDGTTGHVTIL
jgi:pyruvate,water dikinase